ncbi:MAG TPA: HlyD family type I secretion periplasmic adaptor subunit, partial [Devosia sp.]
GWLIIALFFGGFGYWAATAPLNAAVVGEAVVKVEGNRKSVQHLDGGTVKEILVREGDEVKVSDVLLVLDDTQIRAEVDVLRQQLVQLMAVEARLRAEFAGQAEITFPEELTTAADGVAASAITDQQQELATRRQAMTGRELVLRQRMSQYDEQIAGLAAQAQPMESQLESITAERVSLEQLLAKGLTTRTRVLELQRRESELVGRKAELDANIGRSREAIAELREQIAQLQKDQSEEVTAQLRETRAKLLDVRPRLRAAEVALERTAVRTPYAGRVVDLAVHSVGAVIGRGERLLDIVPENTSLVVEAKVRVEDIADIAPGMLAEVHFTSYKQRVTPLIHGLVSEVSADRLTDQRTQVPYYLALVDVDAAELAASPEIQLYPGMPATVMITTKERTALDYLVGPLSSSLERAFRER